MTKARLLQPQFEARNLQLLRVGNARVQSLATKPTRQNHNAKQRWPTTLPTKLNIKLKSRRPEAKRHRVSIPFPRGSFRHADNLVLTDDTENQIPLDIDCLATWSDNSIKWAKLQWSTDNCISEFMLREEPGYQGPTKLINHKRKHTSQILNSVIEVEVLYEGRVLEYRTDAIFEDLFLNSSQIIEGNIAAASGTPPLAIKCQSSVTGHKDLLQITIQLSNPKSANHPGGIWELGDRNSVLLKHATLHIKPTSNQPGRFKPPTLHFRLDQSNADSWETRHNKSFRLNQFDSGGSKQNQNIHIDASGLQSQVMKGYHCIIGTEHRVGDRANPKIILDGEQDTSLGISIPRFWQKFPQSITVTQDSTVTYSFLAETHETVHELLPGEQISCVFLIAIGDTQQIKNNFDSMLFEQTCTVASDWISESEVVPWLTSTTDSRHTEYLDLVNQAIQGPDSFYAKRDKIDQYGWRHFGDVWGDHEAVHSPADDPLVSHYNNQYDMVFGLGINYLRSGDERWFELMRDLARHVIDIDIYHTDEDLPCYNHGMFWHTVHYVDAGLSTHRSYPKGTCGGGPSSGHAYNRGLYLYYCLTGDLTAKEAVINMGEWMIASEDGSKTKYRYLAGGETGLTTASGTEDYHGPGRGPANCVEVLITSFEATHDRKYLTQAEHIIRRVVHPEQDIEALDLLDSENKWFYLMFLQALGRYLELKISLKEIDEMYSYARITLLRYADWMAIHEYPFLDKPEKLEFPTETWAAQDMRKVEVFQWAARHGCERQKQLFLEKASFFFHEAVRQLNEFETKSLCRPIALLLSNGYSHDFFASGKLDEIGPSPPPSVTTFAPQKKFRSQKTRAIRNAKWIACMGGLITLLLIVSLLKMLVG